jgi:hypothetical protein
MTNTQLRRKIERITGRKIHWHIRHDGDNWYESEASSGTTSVYAWSYHGSRAHCYGSILMKLLRNLTAHTGA